MIMNFLIQCCLDTHTCLQDAGSPVYQFDCEVIDGVMYKVPKCLYGMVKSIPYDDLDRTGEHRGCKGPEVFVNITFWRPDILNVIENYERNIRTEA